MTQSRTVDWMLVAAGLLAGLLLFIFAVGCASLRVVPTANVTVGELPSTIKQAVALTADAQKAIRTIEAEIRALTPENLATEQPKVLTAVESLAVQVASLSEKLAVAQSQLVELTKSSKDWQTRIDALEKQNAHLRKQLESKLPWWINLVFIGILLAGLGLSVYLKTPLWGDLGLFVGGGGLVSVWLYNHLTIVLVSVGVIAVVYFAFQYRHEIAAQFKKGK